MNIRISCCAAALAAGALAGLSGCAVVPADAYYGTAYPYSSPYVYPYTYAYPPIGYADPWFWGPAYGFVDFSVVVARRGPRHGSSGFVAPGRPFGGGGAPRMGMGGAGHFGGRGGGHDGGHGGGGHGR
ncbi:hypothetical protein [Variovorax terrae]|uniref:Lipoprotein n=1 Tax=Variovorax terrae TaxID=2923278 RepID=A0A9X1VU12_9BURK|nr:hypothetical protein [Variovorax terrae]MCJ0763243.1 hypothetical protein [Variovorax terrae]